MDQIFSEFQSECLHELTNGANLIRLCDLTAKYTGNPIAITLTAKTIVAASKDYGQDLINEYINSGKYAPIEEFSELADEMDRLLLKGKLVSKASPYIIYKHSLCGCFFGINMIGVLDMPTVNRTPTKDDLDILQAASSLFSLALVINGFSISSNFHPVQSYMLGLLNGSINANTTQNPYHLHSIIKDILSFRLLLIRPVTADQETTMESEILQFCKINKNWWYVPYNHYFIVITASENLSQLSAFTSRLGDSFRICVSDEFSHLSRFLSHIKIAEFALDIAAAEGSQKAVIHTDDYKVFFAAAITRHSDTIPFDNSAFQRIKEYDEHYSASYADTLRAFFRCNQDIQRMAAKLYIHKNTVFYRLNRMKELFDIDYQDIKQMSNLYFSLLIDDNII